MNPERQLKILGSLDSIDKSLQRIAQAAEALVGLAAVVAEHHVEQTKKGEKAPPAIVSADDQIAKLLEGQKARFAKLKENVSG